jgi:N-carbamoylputrescine amidase
MGEQAFTIGLVQQACVEDRAVNLERAAAGVREAAGRGAQVVCLQELFGSVYFCQTISEERFALAEAVPGPTTETMQSLARELGVVIVVPVFERRASGVYHNSAAVVDADGTLLGVYRKMHIPHDPQFEEKYYFTPGDADDTKCGFRVFQTQFAKVGVLICWDQWYPEAARITSLMGAEVLFYPTAIGWIPTESAGLGEAQWDAWRTAQRAHAIANGVYVGAVNRVGLEPRPGGGGVTFFGRSFVSDPFGRVVAEAGSDGAEVLVATCDRTEMETTRRGWPFLRDRRIDAYGPILKRYLDKAHDNTK